MERDPASLMETELDNGKFANNMVANHIVEIVS